MSGNVMWMLSKHYYKHTTSVACTHNVKISCTTKTLVPHIIIVAPKCIEQQTRNALWKTISSFENTLETYCEQISHPPRCNRTCSSGLLLRSCRGSCERAAVRRRELSWRENWRLDGNHSKSSLEKLSFWASYILRPLKTLEDSKYLQHGLNHPSEDSRYF